MCSTHCHYFQTMPDGREVRLVFDKYQKVVNPFTLYAAFPYID